MKTFFLDAIFNSSVWWSPVHELTGTKADTQPRTVEPKSWRRHKQLCRGNKTGWGTAKLKTMRLPKKRQCHSLEKHHGKSEHSNETKGFNPATARPLAGRMIVPDVLRKLMCRSTKKPGEVEQWKRHGQPRKLTSDKTHLTWESVGNSGAWWRFLWSCHSANTVGLLVPICGLLNGENYRQILILHAIPSERHLICLMTRTRTPNIQPMLQSHWVLHFLVLQSMICGLCLARFVKWKQPEWK